LHAAAGAHTVRRGLIARGLGFVLSIRVTGDAFSILTAGRVGDALVTFLVGVVTQPALAALEFDELVPVLSANFEDVAFAATALLLVAASIGRASARCFTARLLGVGAGRFFDIPSVVFIALLEHLPITLIAIGATDGAFFGLAQRAQLG